MWESILDSHFGGMDETILWTGLRPGEYPDLEMIRGSTMTDPGMVTVASGWSVDETIDRLTAAVTGAGLLVFARVDHAGNAAGAGMELRPTQLLIFGNPRGGTPLMLDRQTAGIDLPVKALAWQDEAGQVWLTYNCAAWIAERHGLGADSNASVEAIAAGMAQLVRLAVVRAPETDVRPAHYGDG